MFRFCSVEPPAINELDNDENQREVFPEVSNEQKRTSDYLDLLGS